jgi:hypothetical protein
MWEGLKAGMGGAEGKEDSIVWVGEVGGVIQSNLVCCVVLTIATFPIEPPVLDGVSVYIVHLGT